MQFQLDIGVRSDVVDNFVRAVGDHVARRVAQISTVYVSVDLIRQGLDRILKLTYAPEERYVWLVIGEEPVIPGVTTAEIRAFVEEASDILMLRMGREMIHIAVR